jgi:DMSO/TMAO reductase YedYZ molybdopterin-dependent catalytic subunit
MRTRRNFLTKGISGLVGLGFLLDPLFSAVGAAWAKTKKIVVRPGTNRKDLVSKNPASLDASQLEATPLKDFGTMGLEDHEADLERWRLIVDGQVKRSVSLRYSELIELPSIQRKVLLICPGIFANNGVWKGVSIKELFKKAPIKTDANYVTFRGPAGNYEKVLRVPIDDVLSDRVFLAYRVNGEPLPQKHGFPLRLVAEGYYGYDWVKYVYKVTVDKVTAAPGD